MKKKTTSKTDDKGKDTKLSRNKPKFHTLVVQGTQYKTLVNQKYLNRKKWEPINEKHILSFIPGTITELFVKDGEKVQKNQPLLVLEAMKMENTFFAPFDGKLAKVNVITGQRVPKGEIMIEFE